MYIRYWRQGSKGTACSISDGHHRSTTELGRKKRDIGFGGPLSLPKAHYFFFLVRFLLPLIINYESGAGLGTSASCFIESHNNPGY